jgi:hypothetical protein
MILLAACSSANGNGAGAAPDGGATTDASAAAADVGVPDGASAALTATGTVGGVASVTDPGKPLQGVAVCVLDHPDIPCVMTDGAGQYALPGVPPDADVGISFTKAGYFGELWATHTSSATLKADNYLFTDAFQAQWFQSAGWTYPAAGKGTLSVHAQRMGGGNNCDGLDQTTVAAATGETPVYAKAWSGCADGGVPTFLDPTLTSTTTSGNAVFLAAPGLVDLTAMHSTLTCVSSTYPGEGGWASTSPSTLKAPVRGGYDTTVVFQCN